MSDNVFVILGLDTRKVNLFPASQIEEILQNVAVLITTVEGTVPLDRRIGIPITFIDEPLQEGIIELTVFLLQAIQEYEPRVIVQEIDFVNDADAAMDGKLIPSVKVVIPDEFLA